MWKKSKYSLYWKQKPMSDEKRVKELRELFPIRIDPNFYNTYEELDRFLDIVRSHISHRKNN